MGALMLCAVGCLVGAAIGWSEPLAAQFVDRAVAAGLTQPNVSGTDQSYIVEGMMGGAAFFDYDRDGDVDLYVANYVEFSLDYESPIPCLWKNVKVYCGPVGLLPAADVFYRNNDDGTFAEYGKEAGLQGEAFYGMSVLFGDYDNDGWPDLLVANDSTPNLLFRNRQDGRFAEEALMAGGRPCCRKTRR